jgi:hypothetical protein
MEPAVDGFVDHPAGEGDERDAAHEAGEDFQAPVAVGLVGRRRPHRDHDRQPGERDRHEVREHVDRVVEQRERMGKQAADELAAMTKAVTTSTQNRRLRSPARTTPVIVALSASLGWWC